MSSSSSIFEDSPLSPWVTHGRRACSKARAERVVANGMTPGWETRWGDGAVSSAVTGSIVRENAVGLCVVCPRAVRCLFDEMRSGVG